MKKQIIFTFLLGILLLGIISAHSDEDFAQAESIIQAGTECSQLTEGQLEIMGDYYMEQIHPGEAHEYMDQMMGGEGSENLRQIHIAMAYRFYCNGGNATALNYGMMDDYGMMYPGVMNNSYYSRSLYSWFIPLSLLVIIGLLLILIFKKGGKGKDNGR